MLNYTVTSYHIHLLVKDTGPNVIAQSMQLITGRTAQEYNQRKNRQGAFWEDRYHATAIEQDQHLHRCLVYIDLNMVRAGVVEHPFEWKHSGYREFQNPPERYAVIDLKELKRVCGVAELVEFQQAHQRCVAQALDGAMAGRDPQWWSESIAVGGLAFVENVQSDLGSKATHRKVEQARETYSLWEDSESYGREFTGESESLRPENTIPWQKNHASTET